MNEVTIENFGSIENPTNSSKKGLVHWSKIIISLVKNSICFAGSVDEFSSLMATFHPVYLFIAFRAKESAMLSRDIVLPIEFTCRNFFFFACNISPHKTPS